MIEITKVIEWDMGHRIPRHNGMCRTPHGHRYRLEVTITSDNLGDKGTSQEGMVLDFKDIKRTITEKFTMF